MYTPLTFAIPSGTTPTVKRIEQFVAELKRRKVFRVASAYLVAAWGLSMGAEALFPVFGLPDWTVRAFVIVAFLGFPVAVGMAWVFEITDEGVVRDPKDAEAEAARPARDQSDETMILPASSGPVAVAWQEGGQPRRRHFAKTFLIGRESACEVHLDDPAVSRRHAKITCQNGVWTIEDLGSANGTWIDGKRITTSALGGATSVHLAESGPEINIEITADDTSATMILQS